MFTEAEVKKMNEDRASDALADFIPQDYEGKALDALMDIAVEIAIDEFDADFDGENYVDSTNYEDCMRRAVERHAEDARDAEDERGEYMRGLALDL